MRNVRIRVAYDGARFHGWQRQDGFESVQQALEEAVEALVGEKTVVRGAGRTDSGVHALGQVANFHVDTRLEDDRLCHALNAHLPTGVVVERLETCRADFHAQYDARGKRYGYLIHTSRFRPALGREGAHWVPEALDLGAMRRAAEHVVGERDFRSFASTGSPRKTTVRRVRSLHLLPRRQRLALVVQGDGFLYKMVRTIVGTLLEVGRGKLDPEEVAAVLTAGERSLAGPTAPAQGLYLLSVLYREPCFLGRPSGPRGAPGVFPV